MRSLNTSSGKSDSKLDYILGMTEDRYPLRMTTYQLGLLWRWNWSIQSIISPGDVLLLRERRGLACMYLHYVVQVSSQSYPFMEGDKTKGNAHQFQFGELET